jgi:DNA adenine methylase
MNENLKPLKPFFTRIGSKKSMINILLNYIPQHSVYVEPFVGSGVVFFNIPKIADTYIINDKDSDLIRGYKILKKGIEIPSNIIPNTIAKIQTLYDKPIRNDKDFIIHELLKANTFNSKGDGNIYKTTSHTQKLLQLPLYKKMLQKVTILNQDYLTILSKYDSPNTFFYLDPPYVDSVRFQLYKHSAIDYDLMRDKLKTLKGLFLLSINDDKDMRRIFKEFIVIPILVKNKWKKTIGGDDRKELLVMNYKLT